MNQKPQLHANNHYVPRIYLRSWASSHEKIFTFKTLVTDSRVPYWKENSIRGVAYHEHLYTRIASGLESDEIERWLDKEFESPAQEAIQKAITDQPMTAHDWKMLIRFLAVQDVRTPARMLQAFSRWKTSVPKILKESLDKHHPQLTAANFNNVTQSIHLHYKTQEIPLKISATLNPGQEHGTLSAEMVIGRGLWVHSVRHILTGSLDVLHNHHWTILKPPAGMYWFTNDDPVTKCDSVNFKLIEDEGGWNTNGTCIFLPLGPRHLLYTQVGSRVPLRGTKVSPDKARIIQGLIANGAHRMIFAHLRDPEIPRLRPRHVSAATVREEQEQWRNWNDQQIAAEKELWIESSKKQG